MKDSTCRVLTHVNAHIKETCIHVERDLDSCQKRPVFTAKETNIHDKRELCSREKRPICTSKETCAHVKENLYSCQQAPAVIFTHTLTYTTTCTHTTFILYCHLICLLHKEDTYAVLRSAGHRVRAPRTHTHAIFILCYHPILDYTKLNHSRILK